MVGHITMREVIWDVRIDDYEELEEVRQGLVRSLRDIDRLLDGAQIGALDLLIPQDVHTPF